MAHLVANNALVSLGGTDQSAHCKSVSLNLGDELPDDTTFGDTFRNCLNSIKTLECEIECHNDFADNDFDEDVDALFGTAFAVAIRPVNTTIAATNPEYQFTGAIESLERTFAIGEVSTVKLSIKLSSGSYTRDVTP